MRYTAKYIGFTALCKSRLKRQPSGIVQHVVRKDTLSFLISVIFRNFPGFIMSLFDFILSDFRTPGLKDLKYVLNKQYEVIIMPSYCEKPVNCPDRYEIYCRGMDGQCSNECRFRHYRGFTDKTVHYRFMTHDRGVADMLEYSLKMRSKGRRVLSVMSLCSFAGDIAVLFPLFNMTVLRVIFTSKKNQCSGVLAFFHGDMGNNHNMNTVPQEYDKLIERITASAVLE